MAGASLGDSYRWTRDLQIVYGVRLDANVVELEEYVMNTSPGERTLAHRLLDGHPHLRIDNTHLSAADVADRVVSLSG